MHDAVERVSQHLVNKGYGPKEARDLAEAVQTYFNERMKTEVPEIGRMLEQKLGSGQGSILVLRGHEVPLGKIAKGLVVLFFAGVLGFMVWFANNMDSVSEVFRRNMFIAFGLFLAIGVTMFVAASIRQLKARRLPPVQLEGGLAHG